MADYFDPTDTDHLSLLDLALTEDNLLVSMIDEVEYDLLNEYRLDDSDDVYLDGFHDTDSTQTDATLAIAIRKTIAKIANHRFRWRHHNPFVQSETYGRRGTTFARHINPDWPHDYSRYLRRFDIRPRAW